MLLVVIRPSYLICILIVAVIYSIFFFGLGLTKGFGSPYYPTPYYNGSFSSIFNSSKLYDITIIDIKTFVLYTIPLYILLIATVVAIAILISTLISSSTGALCLSVIVYVTFYIFNSQLRLFGRFAQFIPFTYSNIPSILDGTAMTQLGNSGITYINGVIILTLTTLLCYFLSLVLFRKKDIL